MMLFMDKSLHPICRGRPSPQGSDRLHLKLKNFNHSNSKYKFGTPSPSQVLQHHLVHKDRSQAGSDGEHSERTGLTAWGSIIVEVVS